MDPSFLAGEHGSLLRRLAEEIGRLFWRLFSSWKNVARLLRGSIRFLDREEAWLLRTELASCQFRLLSRQYKDRRRIRA